MAKTQIFKAWIDFYNREDKKMNGVSESFSTDHPDYESDNETNEGCWNCSDCSDCSDCSRCYDCSRCSDCSRCYDYLVNATPVESATSAIVVPVIENIHQKVLQACKGEGALSMLDDGWHKCDTTHCRGGWVVHLAGEAGYTLEKKTSTEFAAMMIYRASSDIRVSPVRFYEPNEVAMADIERCAAEEMKITNPQ